MSRKEYSGQEVPKEYSKELKDIVVAMLAKDQRLRPDTERILGTKFIVLHLSKKLAKQSSLPISKIVMEEKGGNKASMGTARSHKESHEEKREYRMNYKEAKIEPLFKEEYKQNNEHVRNLADLQPRRYVDPVNEDKVDKYTFDIEKYKYFDNRNKADDAKPILQRESNRDVQQKYFPVLNLKQNYEKELGRENLIGHRDFIKPKTPHNFFGNRYLIRVGGRAQREETVHGVCIEPRENFREPVDKNAKHKQTFTQATKDEDVATKEELEEDKSAVAENEYEGQMVDGKREGYGLCCY